jgi:hypothetical protein
MIPCGRTWSRHATYASRHRGLRRAKADAHGACVPARRSMIMRPSAFTRLQTMRAAWFQGESVVDITRQETGSRPAGVNPTYGTAVPQKGGSRTLLRDGDDTMPALVAPAARLDPSTCLCPHRCVCVSRLRPCDHVTVGNHRRAARDTHPIGPDTGSPIEGPATEPWQFYRSFPE